MTEQRENIGPRTEQKQSWFNGNHLDLQEIWRAYVSHNLHQGNISTSPYSGKRRIENIKLHIGQELF